MNSVSTIRNDNRFSTQSKLYITGRFWATQYNLQLSTILMPEWQAGRITNKVKHSNCNQSSKLAELNTTLAIHRTCKHRNNWYQQTTSLLVPSVNNDRDKILHCPVNSPISE